MLVLVEKVQQVRGVIHDISVWSLLQTIIGKRFLPLLNSHLSPTLCPETSRKQLVARRDVTTEVGILLTVSISVYAWSQSRNF